MGMASLCGNKQKILVGGRESSCPELCGIFLNCKIELCGYGMANGLMIDRLPVAKNHDDDFLTPQCEPLVDASCDVMWLEAAAYQ